MRSCVGNLQPKTGQNNGVIEIGSGVPNAQIGKTPIQEGLKYALHGRLDHCEWSPYPKKKKKHWSGKILLPSAVHLEEADSQPISQLDRPAVRQTETHTLWVFCQWQTRVQAVGSTFSLRIGSGRMVMQAAADFLVGGSNPGVSNTAASTDQDSNCRPDWGWI